MKKTKRKGEIATITIRHSQQLEIANSDNSRANATYAEIGDIKAFNVHIEITEIRRIPQVRTQIKILRQIILPTTYLPGSLIFTESATIAESGVIERKTAGFSRTIDSETQSRLTCV